jgi:predicted Zn finger-like uncharacterized protein
MNYITSCPACGTQFLLNTEHLKAHRGKVQCGQCEHIFNAKNRLTEVADDIQSAEQYNASLDAEGDEFEQFENIIPADALQNTPDIDANDAREQSVEEKPIESVLNTVLESVPDLSDLSAQSDLPSSTTNTANTSYIDHYEPDEALDYITNPIVINDLTADGKFTEPVFSNKGYSDTKLNDPKFQQLRSKRTIWLGLLAALFALLALFQSIYFLRDTIAAYYPQYKPYLVKVCQTLQCSIQYPKNLDLLAIDDSDMQEDETHQNVIKFSSLIINNANYIQAFPNIELTLTDTADLPVLRKIVKPDEYLPANSKIEDGMAARENVRINLAINVSELAVAGYRVLLVY